MDNLTLLLDEAEAFARASGKSLKTVSYRLFGHVDRIADYRSGTHSPSLRTIQKGWERLRDLRQGEAAA